MCYEDVRVKGKMKSCVGLNWMKEEEEARKKLPATMTSRQWSLYVCVTSVTCISRDCSVPVRRQAAGTRSVTVTLPTP